MPSFRSSTTTPRVSDGAKILGLAVFLVAYGTNLSTPLLVAYRDRLDLGDSATMAIFTLYVVGILAVLPFAGQLSDRHGRQAIAIPFVITSAAASLVMILGQDNFAFLLLGRLLLGVVSGAVLSVSAAWMQELFGRGGEQRSALISTVLSYGGFGAGPVASALILELDAWPLTLPYVLHAGATLLVVPLLLRVPDGRRRSRTPLRVQLGIPPDGQKIFRRLIAPAAIWVFSFPSASFALFPVIVSDAIEGSDVVVAGASGALTAWSALLSRSILPRLGPERSLPVAMLFGTMGYALGVTAFVTDAWQLVLPAAVLLGAASGLLTSATLALLAEMADESTRGAINATFYLLAYPGMAMPILLTAVGSFIGLAASLVLVTAVAAGATWLIFVRSATAGAR